MRKMIMLTGIALSLLAQRGFASDQETLVIFGDSLSDTGNTLEISTSLGLPPIPPPPYYDGRYSNGPNWVDYVSQKLGYKVKNYALGGAQTGTGNSIPGYPFGGLVQEIGAFAQQNGGKFSDPNHTLTITAIGSNDFLSLLQNPANINPTTVQNKIVTAINDVEAALINIETLGSTKNIVWNLPDLSEIPLLSTPPGDVFGPTFAQITTAYNAGLLELVQGLNENAFNHTQFFYFDADTILNEVRAELIAQGVDVTEHTLTTSFQDPPIVVVTGPPPNDLAFFDQEHPTTLAWSLFATKFAGYIDNLINGPAFLATEQDLIFETARGHRDLVDNHYRMLNMQRIVCPPDYDCCEQPDRFLVYVDGEGKWGSTRRLGGTEGYKYNSQLATVGADYWIDEAVTVGTSFTYENSNAKVHSNRGNLRLTDYIPTVYAAVTTPDGYFADFDLSYHSYHFHNIKRHIPFVDLETKARTSGWGWETNLQLGWLFKMDCLDSVTLGPIGGLGYQTAHIKAYKERGAGYLDFRLRAQRQDSFIGRIGMQAFWNDCDSIFVPYAEVLYEREFTRDPKTLRPSLYHTDDFAIDYHKIGRPERNILSLDIGTNIGLSDNLTGSVAYQGETTFHHFSHAVIGELDFGF